MHNVAVTDPRICSNPFATFVYIPRGSLHRCDRVTDSKRSSSLEYWWRSSMIGQLFSASNDARRHADTNHMVPRLEVRLLVSAEAFSRYVRRTSRLGMGFVH